ncbi:uncharacterized protein LOC126251492 [Schistocerca nitens]|uniref:uncharacterized protein LOC126251492 n=1 Tax=Schistocerca nitens TaxID=7011 RepID=UPI002118AFE6|nr:uncharacterized protein LOC126251492 [Schistocerca nitens]
MRRRSALGSAALLLAAGLWLAGPGPGPAPVAARAMLLPLPRDAARFAAAAAAAEAEYDAVAGVNWPDDEPPPQGLSQEEQTRLLRMLLLRMMQERDQHAQADHDAGPLLEPGDVADDPDGDGEHPLAYGGPHTPDDKRNLQGMMPTLCHFKICHMGRKRNQQKGARTAH